MNNKRIEQLKNKLKLEKIKILKRLLELNEKKKNNFDLNFKQKKTF